MRERRDVFGYFFSRTRHECCDLTVGEVFHYLLRGEIKSAERVDLTWSARSIHATLVIIKPVCSCHVIVSRGSLSGVLYNCGHESYVDE